MSARTLQIETHLLKQQTDITDRRTGTGADTYSSAIAQADNYMRWLLSQFTPYLRGRILETGLGHGGYVEQLRPYGAYIGIDIDEDSVSAAALRYPEQMFIRGDICDPGVFQNPALRNLDTIVTINVLEHIEDDRSAITNLIASLNSHGHLLVSVPALYALYNDLDRLAGHQRRYTTSMLRERLADLPVRIKRLCYFNPVGGLGWWVNGLRSHTSLNSNAVNTQIRIFDKLVVPISRAVDPLFKGFFGQSVTCIVEKL